MATSGTNHPHYYGGRRRALGTDFVSVLVAALAALLRRPIHLLHYHVPAPVLVLLAVQCFWMAYDRFITSSILFAPPRPYIPPTESSPLAPFYGPPYTNYDGPTRVFPLRPSFPCSSLRSEAHISNPSIPPLKSGFLVLTQPQVASTTLSTITSRIARNVARRDHAARIKIERNETACAAWAAPIKAKRFQSRNMADSFLWTMVREPVDRLVSKFFHTVVSREGTEGTMDNFKSFLKRTAYREYGMYMKTMTMRRYISPQQTELYPKYTSEILAAFDFIGVQERWDESLAVLQLLLGLETQDLLYLKTRSSSAPGGASFEPTYNNASDMSKQCVKLQPAQITLEWKRYLHQPFLFEEVFEPDVYFYKAVNASLDATIASLGRDRVDQSVKRLQLAQRTVKARCANSAVYPCSAEGQLQTTADCFFSDVGCGSQCLDSVGSELSTNAAYLQ